MSPNMAVGRSIPEQAFSCAEPEGNGKCRGISLNLTLKNEEKAGRAADRSSTGSTRRSFFKLLAGVAPALFLPKLIVPTFKQTLKYGQPWVCESEVIVHPMMPFAAREFAGKWDFVIFDDEIIFGSHEC